MTCVTVHTSQCTTMGFKALVRGSQGFKVNNLTNQLAIWCHPDLASILPLPTSHLCYVRAAFLSPGLSSLAQEYEKPHSNNQAAWQRANWKKRIVPETA